MASNKAKIRLKLKTYSEQLYYMTDALKLMGDTLGGDSSRRPIYIANAIGHIEKASSMLSLAAQEIESKKQKGE